jgi:hypothetical protein
MTTLVYLGALARGRHRPARAGAFASADGLRLDEGGAVILDCHPLSSIWIRYAKQNQRDVIRVMTVAQ